MVLALSRGLGRIDLHSTDNIFLHVASFSCSAQHAVHLFGDLFRRLPIDDDFQGFGFLGATERVVRRHHVIQLEVVAGEPVHVEPTLGN